MVSKAEDLEHLAKEEQLRVLLPRPLRELVLKDSRKEGRSEAWVVRQALYARFGLDEKRRPGT